MDFTGALAAANNAIHIDSNYHKALANKGYAYFGFKEFGKALECFQKGMSLEPENKIFYEGV